MDARLQLVGIKREYFYMVHKQFILPEGFCWSRTSKISCFKHIHFPRFCWPGGWPCHLLCGSSPQSWGASGSSRLAPRITAEERLWILWSFEKSPFGRKWSKVPLRRFAISRFLLSTMVLSSGLCWFSQKLWLMSMGTGSHQLNLLGHRCDFHALWLCTSSAWWTAGDPSLSQGLGAQRQQRQRQRIRLDLSFDKCSKGSLACETKARSIFCGTFNQQAQQDDVGFCNWWIRKLVPRHAKAYVQYKSDDAVNRALEWNNTWYKGVQITVEKLGADKGHKASARMAKKNR